MIARRVALPGTVLVKSNTMLANERVKWAIAKYVTIFILYFMMNPRSINGTATNVTSAHAM